jgi:Glycosyl transferase family 90
MSQASTRTSSPRRKRPSTLQTSRLRIFVNSLIVGFLLLQIHWYFFSDFSVKLRFYRYYFADTSGTAIDYGLQLWSYVNESKRFTSLASTGNENVSEMPTMHRAEYSTRPVQSEGSNSSIRAKSDETVTSPLIWPNETAREQEGEHGHDNETAAFNETKREVKDALRDSPLPTATKASNLSTQVEMNSTTASLLLPHETHFTKHIRHLVELFDPDNQCEMQKITIVQNSSVAIPHISYQSGSKQESWARIFADGLSRIFRRQDRRPLPNSNLTFAFSMLDKIEKTKKPPCAFGSSAPGGFYSIYNFQDNKRWGVNSTFPSPLPWEQRKTIPVFRGKAWAGVKKSTQKEFQETLPQNASAAKELFLQDLFNTTARAQNRMALCDFSLRHPELLDAKPSQVVSDLWKHNATNGMDRFLPLDKIPESKYYGEYQVAVVLGGVGAAFRTARTMGQRIAVIIQDYTYEEWFHQYMTPYEHYIPLAQDLSNLNKTLHWVRDNPQKVKAIADNGKAFFDQYLSYDAMDEFYYELLFRLMLEVSNDKESQRLAVS